MKSVLVVIAILACAVAAQSPSSCQVSIVQTKQSSWNNAGTIYTLVQVAIKNTGSSTVTAVTLNIKDDAFDNSWEIRKDNGKYTLPDWRDHGGIKVNEEHTWGYVVKQDSPADISVESVECEGSSSLPTPSTEPPTSAPTSAPTSRPTSAPTERPTSAPTSRPTSAPTSRPTSAPTSAPTSRPTNPPTTPPTTRPTSAPTRPPTAAPTTRPTTPPTNPPTTPPTTRPTNPPTNPPTTRPTTPPTTRPTSAPTTTPTTRPTTAPTTAPNTGGRICPTGQVWAPTPGTTWQWQLTGTIDQSLDVQMYDIDLFDSSAATISQLHAKGRVVICYFSTQYEDWRPDASDFPSSVLGSALDDWPGERYVDIRSSIVRNIMSKRLDLAVSKGCDGVEPDNVDSYANSNGLGLKAADQLDFNKFFAQQSHARGLSVGLKNDLDQVSSLVSYFDWALNEQCNEYGECSMLKPFTTANKAVFGTEYSGSASSVCPKMVSDKFSWLFKDLSLSAKVTQCCTYASGGCTKAAYTCVDYQTRRSMYEEHQTEEQVAEVSERVDDVEQHPESSASVTYPAITLFAVATVIALVF